jgi:pyruvate/2-oxoglutarate dehydrogenase complex dihydrolipoamide dehydrogenase (E3) component
MALVKDAKRSLNVVVVGGGPGGMKAAVTAAERGHKVTLLEKSGSLGGLLRFTDYDDLKIDLRRFKDYLIRQTEKADVDVRLNTEATPELIAELAPDAVIVAAGSSPVVPRIPGIDRAVHALDAYRAPEKIGQKIVMVGGGQVGCETGIFFARLGKEVTILEMREELAPEANWMEQEGMKIPMKECGVQVCTGTTCLEILPEGVRVKDENGERIIPADTVIYAVGMRANRDVFGQLEDCAEDVVAVGDCVRARKVLSAVHEAYYAVLDLK